MVGKAPTENNVSSRRGFGQAEMAFQDRSRSFMNRRLELQQDRTIAAGMECTPNILDQKFSLQRQRGQIRSESNRFMRH